MTYNPKVAWAAHLSTEHSTDSSLGIIMVGMVFWISDCPTPSEYVVALLACISVNLWGRQCLLTKIWFIELLCMIVCICLLEAIPP